MSQVSDLVAKSLAHIPAVEGVDDYGTSVNVRARYEDLNTYAVKRIENLGISIYDRFKVFLTLEAVGYTFSIGAANVTYNLFLTCPPAPGILPDPPALAAEKAKVGNS